MEITLAEDSDFPIVHCKIRQKLFVMILSMALQEMMFSTSFAPTWDKPSKSRQITALGGKKHYTSVPQNHLSTNKTKTEK